MNSLLEHQCGRSSRPNLLRHFTLIIRTVCLAVSITELILTQLMNDVTDLVTWSTPILSLSSLTRVQSTGRRVSYFDGSFRELSKITKGTCTNSHYRISLLSIRNLLRREISTSDNSAYDGRFDEFTQFPEKIIPIFKKSHFENMMKINIINSKWYIDIKKWKNWQMERSLEGAQFILWSGAVPSESVQLREHSLVWRNTIHTTHLIISIGQRIRWLRSLMRIRMYWHCSTLWV